MYGDILDQAIQRYATPLQLRADAYVERYGKAKNTGRGEGVQKIMGRRKHKYHAKKCEVDGIVFDSHKEAKRYQELKLLQKVGKISDLELQPEFILQDGFERDGKRYRAIKYVADFQYVQDGKLVVEDTKGYRTNEYLIKRKMFLKNYPEIEFREL